MIILYKSMSENGMHIYIYTRTFYIIYTRTPRLRIKYSFTTHRAGESVLLLLKKRSRKYFVLNKKTRDYIIINMIHPYNILLRILISRHSLSLSLNAFHFPFSFLSLIHLLLDNQMLLYHYIISIYKNI